MGSMWPFLLMYGSHDMRHKGFRRLTVVNKTPGNLGVTTALLLVLQHFCYVGRHVFVCVSTPLFSIVQYFQVPMLCPSHSLFQANIYMISI